MARRRGQGTKQHAVVIMLDGAEHEVTYGIPEMVQWEKNNKGRGFHDQSGEIHFDRMAWVCWCSMKRKGQTELKFDEWLLQVDDIEVVHPGANEDDADPSDPTDTSGSGS